MKLLRKIIGYNLIMPQTTGAALLSRRMRLLNIIRHANSSSPFYAGLYDKFLEHEKDLNDEEFFYAFTHLPIIDQRHTQNNKNDFTPDDVAEKTNLIEDINEKTIKDILIQTVFKKDYRIPLPLTSSDNEKTIRWMDNNDTNQFIHNALCAFKRGGWKKGDTLTIFLHENTIPTKLQSKLSTFLYQFLGINVLPFTQIDKQTVEKLLHSLQKTKSTLLVTIPSTVARVAQIMHNETIEPFEHLPHINVSGEYFMECSKSFIQKMFPDADIQTSYYSSKFGIIAHQKELDSFNYDVFDDQLYLEQGPNNSILLTAYNQRAFPLIRYKIPDMGQIKNHEDEKQTIEFLEGKNTTGLIGADNYLYFASYFNHVINEVNNELNEPIINFTLKHCETDDKKHMQINLILQKPEKRDQVKSLILKTIANVFSNYNSIEINFPKNFDYDYTQRFQVIEEDKTIAKTVISQTILKAS